MSATPTSKQSTSVLSACKMIAAPCAVIAGFIVSAHAVSAQNGVLPEGFYSFAPNKSQATAALSDEASSDLQAAINAYNAKDYGASMPYLQRPADEGSIQANWMIANIMRRGLSGQVDEATAYKHYNRIVVDYLNRPNHILRKDRAFALDSLTRMGDAMRKGRQSAQVEKDQSKALYYYQTAASAGHPRAQYGFALMYLNGEGVPKDRSYAIRWLGTSAQKRYAPAAAKLGDIYNNEGRRVRAVMWYRIAADNAGPKLSVSVLDKHEKLMGQLNEKKQKRADKLYRRWTKKFPLR